MYRSGTWRQHLPAWPLVLTVTPDGARASALCAATAAVLRSRRDAGRIADGTEFDFTSLGELRGPAGPLGPIWRRAGSTERHALVPPDGPPSDDVELRTAASE